jgi:simple sugar transport system permease protein
MSAFLALFTTAFFAAAIRMATPLILGGIGSTFSERAGILYLGVEGTMLIGACAAAIVSYFTASAWLGLLGGIVAGGLVGLLHAFMCIKFHANQTVIGTGINILAMGVTPLLLEALWDSPGTSPTVPGIEALRIPGLADIPILGDIIGTHSPLTFIALILVPVTAFVLFKTRAGLRVRAVGENPLAADTLSVNVYRVQYWSVMFCGLMAGLAGTYLSLCQVDMFVKGMTAGRGFMALAVMIFGKWKPTGVLWGALLFGLAESLEISMQTNGWGVPTDILLSIPYVITILVLAGFVGKAVGPSQVGKPYIKQ